MKIRMKCDHMFLDGKKQIEAGEGDELEVGQAAGIYLQNTGAADVLEHDAPKARAKKSVMKPSA